MSPAGDRRPSYSPKNEARRIAANIAKLPELLAARRLPHWIKVKNPNALAVKREAEEDSGR